jgi:competence protein ComGC
VKIRLNSTRAFTAMELVLVIFVLAVVSFFVIPLYPRKKRRSGYSGKQFETSWCVLPNVG